MFSSGCYYHKAALLVSAICLFYQKTTCFKSVFQPIDISSSPNFYTYQYASSHNSDIVPTILDKRSIVLPKSGAAVVHTQVNKNWGSYPAIERGRLFVNNGYEKAQNSPKRFEQSPVVDRAKSFIAKMTDQVNNQAKSVLIFT